MQLLMRFKILVKRSACLGGEDGRESHAELILLSFNEEVKQRNHCANPSWSSGAMLLPRFIEGG